MFEGGFKLLLENIFNQSLCNRDNQWFIFWLTAEYDPVTDKISRPSNTNIKYINLIFKELNCPEREVWRKQPSIFWNDSQIFTF